MFGIMVCSIPSDSVFFPGPLGGKFPPVLNFPPKQFFFACFSHFHSPQKQIPSLNYIFRKQIADCQLSTSIYFT